MCEALGSAVGADEEGELGFDGGDEEGAEVAGGDVFEGLVRGEDGEMVHERGAESQVGQGRRDEGLLGWVSSVRGTQGACSPTVAVCVCACLDACIVRCGCAGDLVGVAERASEQLAERQLALLRASACSHRRV